MARIRSTKYDKALWDSADGAVKVLASRRLTVFRMKAYGEQQIKARKGCYLLDQMKTVDYHFGMSMEKDFLIPENGTVAVTDAQGTVNDRKDLVCSLQRG